MPVHPSLAPVFEAMALAGPPDPTLTPEERRAVVHTMIETGFNALSETRDPVAIEADHRIEVDGGEITVRIYRPHPDGPSLPAHLYLHGGGFCYGTLDHSDSECRGLATDVDCVVVSVGYRLAPEHKFPTAPEDCYRALEWLSANADLIGVDPGRISVGGASAGGNLAAVVALMARDRVGPPVAFQVIEIPVTDFTGGEGLVVEAEGISIPSGKVQYRADYLDDPADAADPYASPLLADDLAGLPPALVLCVEYDELRDEGLAYAQRLADAGVPVEARCWAGLFHGSQMMSALIPDIATEYHREVVSALRRAFEDRSRLDA